MAPGSQSGKAECISPRRTRQPDAVLPGKVHSATVTFFHLAQGILVSRQIFINLPVADMRRSTAFFTALGFPVNPTFTGEGATCIQISDTITLMLATHAKFRDFTPKEVCDTSKAVEVLFSLSCESREEVDSLVARALAAGGSTYDEPEDFGFMYTHSFVDPDGHGWGVLHMSGDPAP